MGAELENRGDEGRLNSTPPGIKVPIIYLGLSVVIAALVAFSSYLGIFVGSTYARETADWATQARAQDMANIVGIIVLLTSAYFVSKRSTKGVLIWGGSLLFLTYTFVIYTFAVHYNSFFLLYVATLGLTVYTFLGGVLRLDFDQVKALSTVGSKSRRAVSIYLFISAVVFYLLWLSEDVPALLNNTAPASVGQSGLLVNPVHVLDLGLYLPAMIIASVSLWRSRALGYTFSIPLLIFSALTGLGILIIDYLSGAIVSALPQEIFVGTLVIASVILTWLYLRKVTSKRLATETGGQRFHPQLAH